MLFIQIAIIVSVILFTIYWFMPASQLSEKFEGATNVALAEAVVKFISENGELDSTVYKRYLVLLNELGNTSIGLIKYKNLQELYSKRPVTTADINRLI